jgi:predicted dehydrogenase
MRVEPIRVGLVGCGSRGTGAAEDCLKAAPAIRLVALADAFADRLERCRAYLAERRLEGYDVSDERCFVGFDAYRRLLDAGVDLVLLATPPGFRPLHFAAAVAAGKHVFMEKPVAVDPVGVRRILAAGEEAQRKGLGVVAGTLYRHDRKFRATIARVHDGAIGEIRAGRCAYNTGTLWRHDRKPGERDLEWQVRNWYYFDWLSGDHIVEQHVHTLDVMNWVMGGPPVRAGATGGRQVRVGPEHGNIYDHFAVDYEFASGAHVLSMCRQIARAYGEVGAWFTGTKGRAAPYSGRIEGENPWAFEGEAPNAYVLEHTDLIESLRAGKPANETRQIAESTLTAILGREAAYTGKTLSWEDLLASVLDLTPPSLDLENLTSEAVPEIRPVPQPGGAR